jgi:hypothetical protein
MDKRRLYDQSVSYEMYIVSLSFADTCDICGYYTCKPSVVCECKDGIVRCSRCRGNLYGRLSSQLQPKPLGQRIKGD